MPYVKMTEISALFKEKKTKKQLHWIAIVRF